MALPPRHTHMRSPMVYTDLPFILAVAAFGWGLSLATYRWFANRYDWPMGHWHTNRPALPLLIGVLAVLGAILFALARGYSNVPGAAIAGWSIPGFGLLLFLVWTGSCALPLRYRWCSLLPPRHCCWCPGLVALMLWSTTPFARNSANCVNRLRIVAPSRHSAVRIKRALARMRLSHHAAKDISRGLSVGIA
jgi:hypothetical protein